MNYKTIAQIAGAVAGTAAGVYIASRALGYVFKGEIKVTKTEPTNQEETAEVKAADKDNSEEMSFKDQIDHEIDDLTDFFLSFSSRTVDAKGLPIGQAPLSDLTLKDGTYYIGNLPDAKPGILTRTVFGDVILVIDEIDRKSGKVTMSSYCPDDLYGIMPSPTQANDTDTLCVARVYANADKIANMIATNKGS